MNLPVRGNSVLFNTRRSARLVWMTAFACSVTGPTVAVGQSRNEQALEEVVVTAQRRVERVIDTPISIGVISGEELDQRSAPGVADALNRVGGVSVIELYPGASQIAVRGVVPGVGASTTGYYLDEVPFTFIAGSQVPDTNAFDLARVEVLRGPQGTLYGVNALSGVVRVLTNDADLDGFATKVRVRGSDTEDGGNNYGADLAVNVPLIPGELAVRGVVSYSDMSGFIDSQFNGKERFNDSKSRSYRLKVNYQPTENLNIKAGFSRLDIDNGGPSLANDDLTTPFSDDQRDQPVYDAYNLIATYDWSRVSLLSSTSYLDLTSKTRAEILLGGTFRLNFLNEGGLESFAQEVRLNSKLDGPWQWSAGVMYKDTKETQLQDAIPILPFIYLVEEESESEAVFAEITREFADGKFALTGGARYFTDHLVSSQASDFIGGTSDVVPRTPRDFNQTTGRVVLTYKPQPDQMLYASIASGFKSGLNQAPAVVRTNPEFPPLDPDSLITYEVGTKGAVLGGALTHDFAIYYMDWQDIQQSLIVPQGFVARLNAGNASGFGADASLAYQPMDSFELHASVGWNDLKFDEDVLQDNAVLFNKGARPNNSPEWNGSVGGSYSIPTALAGARVTFSTDYTYRMSILERSLTGTILATSESVAVRQLSAAIGIAGDHWSAQLYGDNLLNESGSVTPPNATSSDTSIRMRPRTIGLQATFEY